ncbi:MAG TPA: molybdenum cofactor biosynthesis protein MoaE [Ignavibacteria bacterium]|mgnify:CR=1 FL=1|nr:molybdenum cofactor biosynthesis protein MoaE [Ignavibacteria bacterium]HMR40784.1 molybdenum cofactor biosynthesis protein MoaE [Ignavibacteria bacterium]
MSTKENITGKLFIEGAVSPQFIADSIAKHSSKTNIGAHQIFLGQIRRDEIDGKKVKAIDFSAYKEMAEEEYYNIRELIFSNYDLTCMHVYHSLGMIRAGEINLFVFVSSVHRKDCAEACREMVELIKTKLPIWGKEIFEDNEYSWKVNF